MAFVFFIKSRTPKIVSIPVSMKKFWDVLGSNVFWDDEATGARQKSFCWRHRSLTKWFNAQLHFSS